MIGDELLVYDKTRDTAHSLNRTAATVWQSCDGLGGAALWQNVGLNADGKGQPSQINAMSHGCPPARFRQINVLRTE